MLDRPIRLPSNYRLVYDVVQELRPGQHLAAGDIFARAKALKPSLGYSTVYRALDRLCRLKLVLALHVPELNGALYERAGADHSHFVCRACGTVEDVACDLPMAAIGACVAAFDGEIDDVALTIHGRCAACRAGAPG